jgi:hypothetical protein
VNKRLPLRYRPLHELILGGMNFPNVVLASILFSSIGAQITPAADNRLIFQTSQPWSPRVNINADAVMVYGIDDTVRERIQSWRDHGYHVTVMTGVAWGRYAPYLRGDFDGKQHWDETQQEKTGKLRLHSGREVPYVSPSLSYGRYLAHGVEGALNAGAEAIYLEEPEFWANTGWSESFKREWLDFYHEPWQAPDSSADAQYRASKLKYFLYRRALSQVFDSVKAYGIAHHRSIPCYVATHSLINYAQWDIVSPESSLLSVGADGYIAQVWTGTSRTPNVYEGSLRQRTFETAFLEYGALQNIARASGKLIWYLNDPIEDNPNHSWDDYRSNWESTLVASLLQSEVNRYEVLPWPDRIFGPKALYRASESSSEKITIPKSYETELQTVFHSLGEMNQAASATRWEIAGTRDLGVLVSDTLMFQRAEPQPSDKSLGNFYGLALPLLMRGMPVEPVQIESTYDERSKPDFLSQYKILLLTYEGQKPPSPKFHDAITSWVRAGGALIVMDDDKDPYNRASDWWNSGSSNRLDIPRQHLFRTLGVEPALEGIHSVEKGFVLYAHESPTALSYRKDGSAEVVKLLRKAAGAIHLPIEETNAIVLRRGPYVIGARPDGVGAPNEAVAVLKGDFINLFDPNLAESSTVELHPGAHAFLLDVSYFKAGASDSRIPRILAASGKITGYLATANRAEFQIQGIEDTHGVIRMLCSTTPREVSLNGKPMPIRQYEHSGRTELIHLELAATPQSVRIRF